MPLPCAKALRLAPRPAASAAPVSATVPMARRMSCLDVMPFLLLVALNGWFARRPGNLAAAASDVTLLGRLLVARVDERVDQDRRQQHDAPDQVLRRIRDVENRHAIEERAD